MMLVGFMSHHSNRREDRQFRFFFRRSPSLKLTYKSNWQKANSYDQAMDFKLGSSRYVLPCFATIFYISSCQK